MREIPNNSIDRMLSAAIAFCFYSDDHSIALQLAVTKEESVYCGILTLESSKLCPSPRSSEYVSTSQIELLPANRNQLSSMPLVSISGTDSYVTKPSYERITKPRDWRASLVASLSDRRPDDRYEPTMQVDFDRCVVIAIFRGEERQVASLRVNSCIGDCGRNRSSAHMSMSYGVQDSNKGEQTCRRAERPSRALWSCPRLKNRIVSAREPST